MVSSPTDEGKPISPTFLNMHEITEIDENGHVSLEFYLDKMDQTNARELIVKRCSDMASLHKSMTIFLFGETTLATSIADDLRELYHDGILVRTVRSPP